MGKYILKRIAIGLLVALAVSFLVYFLEDLRPGDPVLTYLSDAYTQEEYDEMAAKLGYDKPLLVRYGQYMWGLLHGDLGTSYAYDLPVWDLFISRLPNTLILSLSAELFAIVLSIPMGIFAARRRGKISDNIISSVATFGLAAPNFWVGLMLIVLFAVKLDWFEFVGFNSWKDLVLPSITIGTGHMAILTRQTRSAMIDVSSEDFLMLARSKGVSEFGVMARHAFQNALLPIITVIFTNIAGVMQGAILTETVFSWPGVGRLTIEAVKANDIELATGCIVMSAIISVMVFVICDLAYMFIDPRVKTRLIK